MAASCIARKVSCWTPRGSAILLAFDDMLESARNGGESGKISRDFSEALVFSMLGFAVGFALGLLCRK